MSYMIAETNVSTSQTSRKYRNGGSQHGCKLMMAFMASLCFSVLMTYAHQAQAADYDPTSLRKILVSVANTPLNKAPFVALNSSGLLAAPIESRGTLSFSANGPIEKHVTSPIDERTTITAEAIRVERAGTPTTELSFTDQPALTAYAQGLRALLGGDTAPLHEHFMLALDGDHHQWRMTLRPKSTRLQTAITSLVVAGTNGLIGSIQTVKTSGDVETLTILLNAPVTSPASDSQ